MNLIRRRNYCASELLWENAPSLVLVFRSSRTAGVAERGTRQFDVLRAGEMRACKMCDIVGDVHAFAPSAVLCVACVVCETNFTI